MSSESYDIFTQEFKTIQSAYTMWVKERDGLCHVNFSTCDTSWQASSCALFSSTCSEHLQFLLFLKEPEYLAGKQTWSPTLFYKILSCLSYNLTIEMKTCKISTRFENCEIETPCISIFYTLKAQEQYWWMIFSYYSLFNNIWISNDD